MIAIIKLIPFLSKAIFFPNSLISNGSVTIPIMVKVAINTATEVIDAPLLRSDAAKGNEIKEGICRIAPRIAMRRIPLNPAPLPAIFEI